MATTPFKAEDSGLLLVFMQPGPQVSLEEFHEWYDNEHVPLRTHRFTTFRSAARYAVTSTAFSPSDAVAPKETTWGAFYTVSSNATFAETAYTSLRSERSKREADLFTRLAIVDRRIYKLEYDSDADNKISVERKRLGLNVQKAQDTGSYLVTNSVDVKPEVQDEYNRWFEQEHVPMLSKVKGWKRSRRFTLIDNGVNGTLAKEGMTEGVPKCLGLHEYDNDAPEDTQEYKDACSTQWRSDILGPNSANLIRRERKTCALYRAWDPIAAIEAEQS
ncbi:hypothetical protein EX895_001926 [Sporisorium graminicola]|uniref:EthD domain-containing protein n=1 Tax=Sporisorium graminicola TaxID=280036 RepID=A0A4U7KX83_9BASI|nr:hypothetical protein EX895_001926 [Sporisorium graminicola]TKY89395.1 hypothetical protein EX895_001926 [Sporisorium graminicola]